MVRIKHNPLSQSVRKALDSVAFAMLAHGVWVSEFAQPDGGKGVEYVLGMGKEGQVVATWDKDARNNADMKWQHNPAVTHTVRGLIEAHASIFATL